MKKFRIIMLVLFSIIDIYTIYATIGYLIQGIQAPKIYGIQYNTRFMGMYIMAITFGIITLIVSTLLIITIIKIVKNNKSKTL